VIGYTVIEVCIQSTFFVDLITSLVFQMAEVHIIGQIESGLEFPKSNLFCKWGIHAGGAWRLIAGVKEGQTHVDNPIHEEVASWSHPIDVHFATKGIQGWPRLHLQVWNQDIHGRNQLFGYGFVHIPTSPGSHLVECMTWKPVGNFQEEMQSYFVGGCPQLRKSDLVYSGVDRYKLFTKAMGKVIIRLNVIFRNFDKYGIEC